MRKNDREGVSTVIGMAIFLVIFAMSASYTLIWTQQFSDYSNAVKDQIEFEQMRNAERLSVEVFKNSTNWWLNVSNPTSQVIVVTQVWSNHNKQTGEWGIPPLGWALIDIEIVDHDNNFKLVTSRGNIFSGKYVTVGGPQPGWWDVTWYNSSIKLGKSAWYNLDIYVNWYKANNTYLGFEANSKLRVISETNPYIVIKEDLPSKVNLTILVDGVVKKNYTDKSQIYNISDVIEGKTYDFTILLNTTGYDDDLELAIAFIGLDFAKDNE